MLSLNTFQEIIEINIAVFLSLSVFFFIISYHLGGDLYLLGVGAICFIAGASHAVVLHHLSKNDR